MNIFKAFVRAGTVKRVYVTRTSEPDGWVVLADVFGQKIEPLERSRGGVRVFRDAGRVVSTLESTGVTEIVFRIDKQKARDSATVGEEGT